MVLRQAAAGAIICDLRHSPGHSGIATGGVSDAERFNDPTYVAAVFRTVYPSPIAGLAATRASGRELIERLRAIAADYKLFLLNDNSRS